MRQKDKKRDKDKKKREKLRCTGFETPGPCVLYTSIYLDLVLTCYNAALKYNTCNRLADSINNKTHSLLGGYLFLPLNVFRVASRLTDDPWKSLK